ncbi:hypothetical protein B0H11DRAFT_2435040 [Mycena galericulata]|nr:hypothetical protein B0H11DRAFT_2435040 [Mycena galericulata]
MSLETDCQLPVRLLPASFPYGASMGARSGWWSLVSWRADLASSCSRSYKNFDDQDMSNKPSGLYIAHTSPAMDEGACLVDSAHAAGTYMGWRKELQHDARERRIKFRITKKLSLLALLQLVFFVTMPGTFVFMFVTGLLASRETLRAELRGSDGIINSYPLSIMQSNSTPNTLANESMAPGANVSTSVIKWEEDKPVDDNNLENLDVKKMSMRSVQSLRLQD